MCLCGMLAADYATLPDPMRERVVRFFDDNEVWLTHVLEEGRKAGTMRFDGSARPVARTLIGGLEGRCSSRGRTATPSGSAMRRTA